MLRAAAGIGVWKWRLRSRANWRWNLSVDWKGKLLKRWVKTTYIPSWVTGMCVRGLPPCLGWPMETRLGATLCGVGDSGPSFTFHPMAAEWEILAIYFLRRFSALVSPLTVSFLAVSAFAFLWLIQLKAASRRSFAGPCLGSQLGGFPDLRMWRRVAGSP